VDPSRQCARQHHPGIRPYPPKRLGEHERDTQHDSQLEHSPPSWLVFHETAKQNASNGESSAQNRDVESRRVNAPHVCPPHALNFSDVVGEAHGHAGAASGLGQTEQPSRPLRGSGGNGCVMLSHLRELIAAIDRRVPDIERVGEIAIARDAAALREKALARIAELGGAD
jgi:hypothetical protein